MLFKFFIIIYMLFLYFKNDINLYSFILNGDLKYLKNILKKL